MGVAAGSFVFGAVACPTAGGSVGNNAGPEDDDDCEAGDDVTELVLAVEAGGSAEGNVGSVKAGADDDSVFFVVPSSAMASELGATMHNDQIS